MPIYEFQCPHCRTKVSLFMRRVASPASPVCTGCGSQEMRRLFSPVAYHRSARDIHESSGDPDRPGADYYKDPRNIGRWVEKRFQQMGMEMPSQVGEMIQAAREGELPGAAKELQPGLK